MTAPAPRIKRRYVKRRYVAHWSALPGGFADFDTADAAIGFALEQARFNSPESSWSVTDKATKIVIAEGNAP